MKYLNWQQCKAKADEATKHFTSHSDLTENIAIILMNFQTELMSSNNKNDNDAIQTIITNHSKKTI